MFFARLNYTELLSWAISKLLSLQKSHYFCWMRNKAYKISAILLCGLLIYNSLGYFLVLSAMRIAVRQQKWNQLSSLPIEKLSVFCFEKSGSSSLKIINEREILVDGKLYDVVRKTEIGSKTTYYCLRDLKEESLIAKIRSFNHSQHQFPNKNTARIIVEKIIKTAVILDRKPLIIRNYTILKPNITFLPLSGPFFRILLPPPKIFC